MSSNSPRVFALGRPLIKIYICFHFKVPVVHFSKIYLQENLKLRKNKKDQTLFSEFTRAFLLIMNESSYEFIHVQNFKSLLPHPGHLRGQVC